MNYHLVGVMVNDVFHANEAVEKLSANKSTHLSGMWADTDAAVLTSNIERNVHKRDATAYAVFQVGDVFVIDKASWGDMLLQRMKRFSSVETAITAVRFGWQPKP